MTFKHKFVKGYFKGDFKRGLLQELFIRITLKESCYTEKCDHGYIAVVTAKIA